MKITVLRQFQTKRTTVSTVFIDGKFQCFGLENPHHDIKIPGNTRIPSGKYPVRLRTTGMKQIQYNRLFPDSHQGMLEIKDVPRFKYILIHIGNFHWDTDGCLLLGKSVKPQGSENYMVGASRSAYLTLYNKVLAAVLDDNLYIEISDEC